MWSEDAKVAWSVIKDVEIESVRRDTAIVARSWLNAHIRAWRKAILKSPKGAGVKDSNGNVSIQLIHSKSPLKELSETAYREKTKDLDLTKEWASEEPPPKHHIVMCIAFLIYDLNKCSISWTAQNVLDCAKLMEVCKSFTKHDDDYSNTYETLPTVAITEEVAKIKMSQNQDSEQKTQQSHHKKLVSEMKTLEDLRIVLVQLVTAAKSESVSSLMAEQCTSITAELKRFDWAKFDVGKDYFF